MVPEFIPALRQMLTIEAMNSIPDDDAAATRIIRDSRAVDQFLARLELEIKTEYTDNGG